MLRVRSFVACLLLAIAAGCSSGGSGSSTPTPAPSPSPSPAPSPSPSPNPSPSPVPTDTGTPGFTISVAPDPLNVPQGGSATIEITVKPESGFADVVDVTVDGLPAGVTATALSVVPPETTGTITFTSLPTAAVPLPIEARVRGKSSGGTESVPVHLTVRGAPGDRDGSFGTDGRVVSWSLFAANDVARQSDGKLLITGWYIGPPEDPRLTICRFQPNGTPDVSFGAPDGCARLDTGGDGLGHGERIELRGGKIYVVGYNNTDSRGFIARVTLAGQLDSSFGGTGVVVLGNQFEPARLRFDDGGIVIAGGVWSGRTQLLRVSLDGLFDWAFLANHVLGLPGSDQMDLVRLDDGRLLVGEWSTVYAFNADGSMDTSFGFNGVLDLSILDGGPRTLSVDGFGGILAAGAWMEVTRFSKSGDVIATYGPLHPGIDTSTGWEWMPVAEDLWVLDDGTMVIAGFCETDWNAICVGRRLPDGRADPHFGTGGVVIVDYEHWGANGVEVLPDGRYVLVGNLHGYGAALIWRIWD